MNKHATAVLAALGIMIMAAVGAADAGPVQEPAAGPAQARAAVTDPVCGMRIDPEHAAATAEYRGTTYYFCTKADRDAFVAAPEKYLAAAPSGPSRGMEHGGEMKHGGMEHGGEMEHGGMEHGGEMEHDHDHGAGGHGHWTAPPEAAARPNPVKATPEVLKKSAALFAQKCALCHGSGGKGDGVLAATLKPRPSDLTSEHTLMHPDGALFYKISEGRGAMPAWKSSLSEEERWGLVHYIRSLSREQEPAD